MAAILSRGDELTLVQGEEMASIMLVGFLPTGLVDLQCCDNNNHCYEGV